MSKPNDQTAGEAAAPRIEADSVGGQALPASRWRPNRRTGWALVLAVLVVFVWAALWSAPAADPVILMTEARQHRDAGNWEAARKSATKAFEGSEGNSVVRGDAALMLGQLAEQEDSLSDAVSWFDRVPDASPAVGVARQSAGVLYTDKLHMLGQAIKRFEMVHRSDPESLEARRRLAQVLGLATRNHDAEQHLVALIRLGHISHLELLLLVLGEETVDDEEVLNRYRQAAPRDAHPLVALSRVARDAGDLERAEDLLREARRLDPGLVDAVVRLGEVLVERGDGPALLEWYREDLDESTRSHPGTHLVLGDMFRLAGADLMAISCFREAVLGDPNRPDACYRLGRVLVETGGAKRAGVFLDRARALEAYVEAAKVAKSPDDIAAVAQRAGELSLPWEEYAWTALWASVRSADVRAAGRLAEIRSSLATLPPARTGSWENPASKMVMTSHPVPKLTASVVRGLEGRRRTRRDAVSPSPDSQIRFEDVTQPMGLDFRFVNGPGRPEAIRFMYQTTGGGVGVLDIDRNGWPDLWWSQGASQPTGLDSRYSDQLVLNTGHGQWLDVTAQSGIREFHFSQGVAVGDVDSDGFPDVLVTNLDGNTLWMNNGDGTFSGSDMPGGMPRWSTSGLVADLDGDGHPELLAVNYLAGSDVFTRRCQAPDGSRGICTPQTFATSPDQVLRSLGDGRWEDTSVEWGFDRDGGSGLGVLAGRLSSTTPPGRLDVFVANDTRANFLYRRVSTPNVTGMSWQEQGLGLGVALNDSGRAEASMGIAAGDVDGDGRPDLLVTNFLDETNTLYRQGDRGLFMDATRSAGLESVSRDQLGFGTQFLDADLDGVLDLVVTNGHIEEMGEGPGRRPFRMSPQFFWNDGTGRFHLQDAGDLGPFFGGKYLGRGLARLDMDRDGAPDFAVSHIDRPASVLANRTTGRGHHVVLRLVGTVSSRDAIGSVVTYRLGSMVVSRQLTAGDGYQASNQRVLFLGLGHLESVPSLEVTWPSGQVQLIETLPVDSEVTLVEGRSDAFVLPR